MTSTISSAPEVQTAAGRVRGTAGEGVAIFRGIPYGAPTSGPNRFMPPQPAGVWTGVRECVDYGPTGRSTRACAGSDLARALDHNEASRYARGRITGSGARPRLIAPVRGPRHRTTQPARGSWTVHRLLPKTPPATL
jgi:hypothetical protein